MLDNCTNQSRFVHLGPQIISNFRPRIVSIDFTTWLNVTFVFFISQFSNSHDRNPKLNSQILNNKYSSKSWFPVCKHSRQYVYMQYVFLFNMCLYRIYIFSFKKIYLFKMAMLTEILWNQPCVNYFVTITIYLLHQAWDEITLIFSLGLTLRFVKKKCFHLTLFTSQKTLARNKAELKMLYFK